MFRRTGIPRVQSHESNLSDESFLMSHQHHLQMTLENDPNMIAEAAKQVAELARQQGHFSEREEFQVFLSVAEAISNAIVHGNLEVSSQLREESDTYEQTITSRQQRDPFRSRTVEVRCCVEAGALSIEIENDGPGFDISKVEDPTKWENLDKPSGRGLHIMRTYFDLGSVP